MLKKIFGLFILILEVTSSFAQEIRAIDNKGTIKNIRNNQVTSSATSPSSPLENDIWFDNTDATNELTKVWDGSAWKDVKVDINNINKTIILNTSGGSLPTAFNTFFNLPIPVDATNIQHIDSDYYDFTGVGQITILKTGNYLISGEISTSNMPSGDNKYILAVFINGVRRAYLSRGFASVPSQDYWGTTGVIMYSLNANDVVDIRYVLNVGGTTLTADFLNIGITNL